jgi:hypothetical protein
MNTTKWLIILSKSKILENCHSQEWEEGLFLIFLGIFLYFYFYSIVNRRKYPNKSREKKKRDICPNNMLCCSVGCPGLHLQALRSLC